MTSGRKTAARLPYLLSLILGLHPPALLVAQQVEVPDFYFFNAPTWGEAGPISSGGLADFQRLRAMVTPTWGPAELEVAYEHTVQLRQHGSTGVGLGAGVLVPQSTTWLPLQWDIVDDQHLSWSHRFDRLALSTAGGDWDLAMGRQAVSWATTLFLTPADPFAPFDPSDPFREYRAGIDGARLRYFPGPLSEVDLVVRPSDVGSETTMTALVRGRTGFGRWDLSAWLGVIHDEFGAAVAGSRSVAGFEIRGELSLRRDPSGSGTVLRGTIGADRRFGLAGRDLYVVVEYQHDGFGASGPAGLVEVLGSAPFQRGELQVLGRDEIAAQGSYQLHPLWNLSLVTLLNLHDGSGLLIPGVSYSVGANVRLQAGLFGGWGDGAVSSTGLGSEYGAVPLTGYGSVSWFF